MSWPCRICGKKFKDIAECDAHEWDAHFALPSEGPDARRVSGASDCSDPRSGADNRAALAAKRPIPPRVAGRNTLEQGTGHLVHGTLPQVVGGTNQEDKQ